MPTNASNVAKYLELSLLQLGAESYLHNADFETEDEVVNAWKFGFNDVSHPFIRDTLQATPDSARLPGNNRMVESQARDLFTNSEIIDHHANDATGFSATLFGKRLIPGDLNSPIISYTFSIRSTEARPWAVAGDEERDMAGAGKGGVYEQGFAFAQLAAMEDYWSHIRSGQRWDRESKEWRDDSSGELGAFREFMTRKQLEGDDSTDQFNVTGYSLGGHMAGVFALMHAEEVTKTYTFNAAGHGVFASKPTTGETIAQMLAVFRQALLEPASTPAPNPILNPVLHTWRLAAIDQKAADGASDPFVTENGLIDKAPATPDVRRGNVYENARYEYAERYVQSLVPTFSLADGPLKAVFGIGPFAVLGSLLGANDFQAYGQAIENGRGSQDVTGPGYDDIVSISGQATHDDFLGVADSQRHTANRVSLFIEDQPDVYGKGGLLPVNTVFGTSRIAKQIAANKDGGPGDYATSHSLVLLIDTLSLAAAIQEMSPEASLEDIEGLMAVASNLRGESDYSPFGTAKSDPGYSEHNSLENLLDALRRVFDANALSTPAERVNDDFGNFSNRTQYHANLAQVRERKGQGLELKSLIALPPSATIADRKSVV